MEILEKFRGLVEEVAGVRNLGFCIRDEIIDPDDFFDYEVGLPIACLAGIDLARSMGVQNRLLLVRLRMNEDHPAYCSIEFNPGCKGNEEAALLSTITYVSSGLEELSNIIKPSIVQGEVRYIAIEDIAAHVESVRSSTNQVNNPEGLNKLSMGESMGAVSAVVRAVGVEPVSDPKAIQPEKVN